MEDLLGRKHTYLRISLTHNCNLRCFYCLPAESYTHTPAAAMMQADEIAALAKLFVQHGVTKIRLTGGEPLVRKDAAVIIQSLAALPVSLAITTNGVRIAENLGMLKAAGIRSVNVSLDTLQAQQFQRITHRDLFHKVYNNIELLLHNDFQVKVNMVVMKGVNEAEITDFIEWTRHSPIQVRFIEFMPFTGNQWNSAAVFTWQDTLAAIEQAYAIEALPALPNDVAKRYRVPGHIGSFAIISTMSAPFCSTCNRMRLTADGKMKNCLFSSSETDLLRALRNGEDVAALMQENLHQKAAERGGQFVPDFAQLQSGNIHNRSMITIGG